MVRLEQIAAIFLAAALAIPSYWFFWTMAGGGGYDKRKVNHINQIQTPSKVENKSQATSSFD